MSIRSNLYDFLKSETRCQHVKAPHSSGFWNCLAIGLLLKREQKTTEKIQTNKQKQPKKLNTYFKQRDDI